MQPHSLCFESVQVRDRENSFFPSLLKNILLNWSDISPCSKSNVISYDIFSSEKESGHFFQNIAKNLCYNRDVYHYFYHRYYHSHFSYHLQLPSLLTLQLFSLYHHFTVFSRGYAKRRNSSCCGSEYANLLLTQM